MLRRRSAYLALLLATACTDSLNVGEVELEEDAGGDASRTGTDGGSSVTEDPLERYANAVVGDWYLPVSPEAYATLYFKKTGPRSGTWTLSCSTTVMRGCFEDVGKDAGPSPFGTMSEFSAFLEVAGGNFYIVDSQDNKAAGVLMVPFLSANFEVEVSGNRLDVTFTFPFPWTRTKPTLRPRPDGGFP